MNKELKANEIKVNESEVNESVELVSELSDEDLNHLKGGVYASMIEADKGESIETSYGSKDCCNTAW